MQLYLIAKKLADDYSVSFIVGNYNQKKEQTIDNVNIIRSIRVQKNDKMIISLLKAVKLFIDLMKQNAMVYIQRSASMGTGLIALYCSIFRKRFIYMTAHEIDCNGEYKKQAGIIHGVFYEFGLKRSYKVISQSEEQRNMLRSTFNIKSEIIHSVYEIPLNRNKGQHRKGPVLWIGRCEYWKRPEIFISLASQNSEHDFLMIMPRANTSNYYDKVLNESSPLPENLKIINFVRFNEIGSYFESSSVFVNTSISEGFPNTFIQSAMHGVPILSLSVNPDQIIDRFNLGRICNDDEKKLHAELDNILNNEEEYREMSNNCYSYAKNNHDIDKNIKILQNVIA